MKIDTDGEHPPAPEAVAEWRPHRGSNTANCERCTPALTVLLRTDEIGHRDLLLIARQGGGDVPVGRARRGTTAQDVTTKVRCDSGVERGHA